MWELEDTILLVPHLQGCISQESVWKPSQTGNWKEENLAAVQVWVFTVVLPRWATGPLWTFPQLWSLQNNTFLKGDKRIKCKPLKLWLQLQVTWGKKTEMLMLGCIPIVKSQSVSSSVMSDSLWPHRLYPGGAWNATPRSLPSLERKIRSRTHA